MVNWKKTENEKGYIYYINFKQEKLEKVGDARMFQCILYGIASLLNILFFLFISIYNSMDASTKQWDHPKFIDIKQAIDDCNYVIYPLYRLALKFRILQRSLHLEEVPLSVIRAIFERHRLGNSESSLTLETCDLEAVLSDVFFAANKKNHTNIDIDFATEMVINFLFNVFDRFREGNIQVFSTKILLGILSNCSLVELYKFIFSLCADHNNCITRLRLQGLLLKIFELIKYLHEDVSLGVKNINSAIEGCFQNTPGLVGIAESNFIDWLETNPPFLSWVPLISKLKFAETVLHSVKCTTCKTRPLMGLRYRCIKCSRYTQCQRCFLTGRISHSHKLSHSVREYSGVNVSKDNAGFLLRKFCGLFCPVADSNFSVVRPTRCFTTENIKPYISTEPLCDVEPLSSPQSQLQGVIRQLESQNRELQQMLIFGNYSDKEMRKYLEEYRLFMAGNIKKLKILKRRINIPTDTEVAEYENCKTSNILNIQSTPMVQFNNVGRCKNIELEKNMSPVTVMTEIDDSLSKDYIIMENGTNFKIQQGSINSENYDDYSCWNKETRYPLPEPADLEQKCNGLVIKSPVKLLHNDLDEALARLQQILANNFSLEDSLNPIDNTNLKFAVTEVEGMLTSIIDNVESSRSNSAPPGREFYKD